MNTIIMSVHEPEEFLRVKARLPAQSAPIESSWILTGWVIHFIITYLKMILTESIKAINLKYLQSWSLFIATIFTATHIWHRTNDRRPKSEHVSRHFLCLARL